jgi:hypothetical protein
MNAVSRQNAAASPALTVPPGCGGIILTPPRKRKFLHYIGSVRLPGKPVTA